MSPEIVEKIVESLKPLADKIGKTGEAAFGWALEWTIAVAVSQVIWGSILVVIGICVSILACKKGHILRSVLRDSFPLPWILLAVMLLVGLLLLTQGCLSLAAPEWQALSYILTLGTRD